MHVEIIPCSFDNYSYLIACEETGEAAVIDPTEAYPVMARASALGFRLTKVLCTHHHRDHVGEIGLLVEELPGLEVCCHQVDRDRIDHAGTLLTDGAEVRVGSLEGEVLHTPGHTRGSVCYAFADALFTGDTLFAAGCGRLFEGTPEEMFTSLTRIRDTFPERTRLYFGHEYARQNLAFASTIEPDNQRIRERMARLTEYGPDMPSTMELEEATNPFLRCHVEAIVGQLVERGLRSLDKPTDVFAALRELRNHFKG